MDVTVAIATFGDNSWIKLAGQRAAPSATPQAPVRYVHGKSLHEARNELLDIVDTEWIVYLDADDELEPGYIDAMATGTADVRGPIARYIRGHRERLWQPRVAGHTHDCSGACLPDGNWLLIGAAVRTQLLRDAGGWEPWPVYEDWAIWLRCWTLGATFELVPDAIYRAHVRPDSRNREPSIQEKNDVHRNIVQAVLPHRMAA